LLPIFGFPQKKKKKYKKNISKKIFRRNLKKKSEKRMMDCRKKAKIGFGGSKMQKVEI
jgi:hypothetical protein